METTKTITEQRIAHERRVLRTLNGDAIAAVLAAPPPAMLYRGQREGLTWEAFCRDLAVMLEQATMHDESVQHDLRSRGWLATPTEATEEDIHGWPYTFRSALVQPGQRCRLLPTPQGCQLGNLSDQAHVHLRAVVLSPETCAAFDEITFIVGCCWVLAPSPGWLFREPVRVFRSNAIVPPRQNVEFTARNCSDKPAIFEGVVFTAREKRHCAVCGQKRLGWERVDDGICCGMPMAALPVEEWG